MHGYTFENCLKTNMDWCWCLTSTQLLTSKQMICHSNVSNVSIDCSVKNRIKSTITRVIFNKINILTKLKLIKAIVL